MGRYTAAGIEEGVEEGGYLEREKDKGFVCVCVCMLRETNS